MLSGDFGMKKQRNLRWLVGKLKDFIVFTVKYRILVRHTSLVYAVASANYMPAYVADVRPVTQENVDDAKSFQDDHYLRIFHEFLDRGDEGYYAYLDGKCAHRSWVPHNGIMDVDLFYNRPMKKNEVFIHWCETAAWARGKNLYPATLARIITDHPGKRVCISVNEMNTASRRGIEKAGFELQERITSMVVLGMKWTSIEDMTINVREGGPSV